MAHVGKQYPYLGDATAVSAAAFPGYVPRRVRVQTEPLQPAGWSIFAGLDLISAIGEVEPDRETVTYGLTLVVPGVDGAGVSIRTVFVDGVKYCRAALVIVLTGFDGIAAIHDTPAPCTSQVYFPLFIHEGLMGPLDPPVAINGTISPLNWPDSMPPASAEHLQSWIWDG